MPELHLVGNALTEPNRIEILNLLLQKGELTIKDIVQELGFSGTNTYYHLNLMFRANIVKCRSSGKPVYYSINRRGFDEICKQLSKYSTAIDANDQY
jgi:DNA-binding transcriptional ArsR family regulator